MKMEVFKEGEADKTMRQHVMRGKTEMFLKTIMKMTLNAQNTRFTRLELVTNKSPVQVTKNSCDKILKICLSVFREWKDHL